MLEELARFAGADLGSAFSAGAQTPGLGSRTEPLHLPPDELAHIFDWFVLGWRVLDTVASGLPAKWTQSTVQLWPEHFDVGTSLDFGRSDGVNLGFSAGDAFSDEPYAYVGPRGLERRGDPGLERAVRCPRDAIPSRRRVGVCDLPSIRPRAVR
jgi:hypothetical protein